MLIFVALYHKLLSHSISAVYLLTIKPTFVKVFVSCQQMNVGGYLCAAVSIGRFGPQKYVKCSLSMKEFRTVHLYNYHSISPCWHWYVQLLVAHGYTID